MRIEPFHDYVLYGKGMLYFNYLLTIDDGVYSCEIGERRGLVQWVDDSGDCGKDDCFAEKLSLSITGDLPKPKIMDRNNQVVETILEVESDQLVELFCQVPGVGSSIPATDARGKKPLVGSSCLLLSD